MCQTITSSRTNDVDLECLSPSDFDVTSADSCQFNNGNELHHLATTPAPSIAGANNTCELHPNTDVALGVCDCCSNHRNFDQSFHSIFNSPTDSFWNFELYQYQIQHGHYGHQQLQSCETKTTSTAVHGLI